MRIPVFVAHGRAVWQHVLHCQCSALRTPSSALIILTAGAASPPCEATPGVRPPGGRNVPLRIRVSARPDGLASLIQISMRKVEHVCLM